MLRDKHDATYEMFQEEYLMFRARSGDIQFSCEDMDRMYQELAATFFRAMMNPDILQSDKATMRSFWEAASLEHMMRQTYRALRPAHVTLRKLQEEP